jgi:hypothetical protein
MRRVRWLYRKAMMGLPACQQRALGRIEQTLVAEDPDLGLRFAVFARLTRHEAMPGSEQIPSRVQRFLRPALMLPVMLVSLVAVLAGGWLIPSGQACPAGTGAATRSIASVSHPAGCQPGPAIMLDPRPMH